MIGAAVYEVHFGQLAALSKSDGCSTFNIDWCRRLLRLPRKVDRSIEVGSGGMRS